MAVVLSGGVAVSSYKPTPVPGAAVKLTDSESSTYAQLWKTQPQIRKVVGFLARNCAQLGLHCYRRVSELDRERVTDHPLAQLLNRPNPWTTRYRHIEALVSDLAIFDNHVDLKVNLPGQPMSVVRLDPTRITPTGDNPFVATGYKLDKLELKPEQVIHYRGYSPLDARWGVSPMETLRELLAEERQATLYREQLWRNGARMAGYLRRPAEAPAWTPKGKERFRAQWQAQYSGDGSRAGGTPILEDGMEYVPAGTTSRDAQAVEWRKLTREEVTSAYHIPLTLVGILDHATYSNIAEQHKMLYVDTLGPTLQMIQQEIELQLLPDFAQADDLYVEFNIAEKLKGSFEEQATQLQTSVGGPWMTRNEARARVNLPQLPTGDELIVPLNVTAGDPAAAPETTEAPKVTAPRAAKASLDLAELTSAEIAEIWAAAGVTQPAA